MKKFIKVIVVIALLGAAYNYIRRGCEKLSHGFSIIGISSDFPYNPQWATPEPVGEEKENLMHMLGQKFTYLNCGGQSYAFLSEDGKVVLKFFKLSRRRLAPAWKYIPLPSFLNKYRQKWITVKRSKLERDFGSYMIAYNELRDETGLLYLHLNKTHCLNKKIKIVDKIGIEHEIDLDGKEFLLQRRVTLAYEKIDRLMKEGKVEESKRKIDSLIELLLVRYKKGIFDDDAFINKNYGFDGDTPILLDLGRFQKIPEYSKPENYKKDLWLVTERFREWLMKKHPELDPYLEEKRNSIE